ncbi:FAD-dependent oxidoreductase [Chamaesiphon minutus]|uniref:Putative NAD/FAD-binding protein n=1 Tax=Chamaesiphon minutus (strain ATCC 27169 / PCC 6605) TaxID=1173020 RepID=K9UNB1_CHAP6|nr:FAD-dependent oxidoreductase [Chamaesiphon minutus]AFY95689.1 putative NAD/FAD-binding protein [Chamaesiphon minutus PCC 6605]
MKIAVIGGGASGIVTAYLLDKKGHQVTVFEKQPILGGHIRSLNKNVKTDSQNRDLFLEAGVVEFTRKFHNFIALMQELDVELEPVELGSALYFKDGNRFLSATTIRKNITVIQRLTEYLRLDSLYIRSIGLQLKMHFANIQSLYDRPLSKYLPTKCARNYWLKLLTMYSYSIPFEQIDDVPAELAIPSLRDYVLTEWVCIKGGVYSYIEKILERFRGTVLLNVDVTEVWRTPEGKVRVKLAGKLPQLFDKVVFATPPDRVLVLLADPTDAELRRFGAWQPNYATTIVHTDTSMYARYGIKQLTEFDFFQTPHGWGYNAYLNQLCGITSPRQYNLAFHLEDSIDPTQIVHIQQHHTPKYTVESFRYRDEVVATNGEYHTYHAGAYLADGLHEGAICSAMRVAELIQSS